MECRSWGKEGNYLGVEFEMNSSLHRLPEPSRTLGLYLPFPFVLATLFKAMTKCPALVTKGRRVHLGAPLKRECGHPLWQEGVWWKRHEAAGRIMSKVGRQTGSDHFLLLPFAFSRGIQPLGCCCQNSKWLPSQVSLFANPLTDRHRVVCPG